MNDGLCEKCHNPLPVYLDKDFVTCPHCGADFCATSPKKVPNPTYTPKSWPLKVIKIARKAWVGVLSLFTVFLLFQGLMSQLYVSYDATETVRVLDNEIKSLPQQEPTLLINDFNIYLEDINWFLKTSEKIGKTEKQIKGCMKTSYSIDTTSPSGQDWLITFSCNSDEDSLDEAQFVVKRLKRLFVHFLGVEVRKKN